MAKLGVLSAADEAIINAIIPDDPLAFQASSLMGQDPILENLKKFRADKNNDFAARVATRTREGLANYVAGGPQGGGEEMVTMLSPKGKPKKVPKSQVEAALAAGGTILDNPNKNVAVK